MYSTSSIVYDYDVQGAKYATCSGGCANQSSWGSLDLGITPDRAAMGIDGLGRLHLVTGSYLNPGLQYATCASNCTVLANWSFGTFDESAAMICCPNVSTGADGTVHVAFWDMANNITVWYSTCSSNCTMASNWSTTSVASPADGSSMAVDSIGGVHITYFTEPNTVLTYAHY